MPIVPSPTHGGWIKVSPPRRNPQKQRAQQDAAMRGPLAYFSCVPVPNKPPTKLAPCPQYDIDDDGQVRPRKKNSSSKDRIVSAPAAPRRRNREIRHEEEGYSDDQDSHDDYQQEHYNHHSHRSNERRSPPSHDRTRPTNHHNSNHGSRAPAPTSAQPRATSHYWTGPTKTTTHAPRSYTSSQTGSSSSRSTVSARWANATAALDLG